MNDLANAILASAGNLGIDPIDLGTAISYETAGTFDPWKAGPTTKYGQHRGLIQWGEPQRREFGVYQGMPNAEQMRAVEAYLTKAGVRPGMGLMDVYSAINAGRVGRYNASDAAAGGAPGTVADKVNNQMAGHRRNAMALLGRQAAPPAQNVAALYAGPAPAAPQAVAPVTPAVPQAAAPAAWQGPTPLGAAIAGGAAALSAAVPASDAEALAERKRRLLAML